MAMDPEMIDVVYKATCQGHLDQVHFDKMPQDGAVALFLSAFAVELPRLGRIYWRSIAEKIFPVKDDEALVWTYKMIPYLVVAAEALGGETAKLSPLFKQIYCILDHRADDTIVFLRGGEWYVKTKVTPDKYALVDTLCVRIEYFEQEYNRWQIVPSLIRDIKEAEQKGLDFEATETETSTKTPAQNPGPTPEPTSTPPPHSF